MTKHAPRKQFGQHFLIDQTIIAHILRCLQIKANDHLVEIGPGLGALTLPLLTQLDKESQTTVDVIEFDRDLIASLMAYQSRFPNLTVHAHDALTFNFSTLKQDARFLRIFGNLPYNISTPLLFHLVHYADIIKDMLFMLQKEVAQRLVALANSEHYGRLSVMMQYHCAADYLFDVPPTAFSPPPKVMSSMIILKPYQIKPYIANDYAAFAEMVKCAFGQRRKTLRNSLKKLIDDKQWSRLTIDPHLRAENLTVADFVAISNGLTG